MRVLDILGVMPYFYKKSNSERTLYIYQNVHPPRPRIVLLPDFLIPWGFPLPSPGLWPIFLLNFGFFNLHL